ncbi:MAG: hypothetical protein KIT22_07655 [Verrucomicrobiae bacterium]|nr:hypothetical protein [Verrucomicrobiae bacterium]
MALTRIPGLMPPNFSAVYAFVFCAGALLPGPRAWILPFGLLVATDLALNGYYQWVRGWEVFTLTGLAFQTANYAGYAALFGLGRGFRPARRWLALVAGGLLGATVFYLVTNTAAWLFNPFRNPEYTRSLAGWLVALTKGTGGYPQTWEFFRNTLLSGGLFTALFAGAWRVTACESPADKGESEAPESEAPSDDAPIPGGAET